LLAQGLTLLSASVGSIIGAECRNIISFSLTNLDLMDACRGYMAPEYTTFGHLSKKVNVFSFGVLCLGIVAGRKNIKKNHLMNNIFQVG
jgi:serine/threonine protein kinase